ncbi:hypothetical protein [Desnuesiella massiliensis]|uniref:hypothetical protein n=1 Tax=Desnuesiella massiliensis TaxID=1650662 RepID=UPI0006E22CD3|nr:hypothetical protein [Desnuesiella massiliensis]
MNRIKYILLFIILILTMVAGLTKVNIECSKSNYALAGSEWQSGNADIQKDEGYYKVLRELRDEAPIKILLNKESNSISINLKSYEIKFKKDLFTNLKNNIVNFLDNTYHFIKGFFNKVS